MIACVKTLVTTTYLEQTDPGQLRPAQREVTDLHIAQAHIPSPELSRYLYTAVGGDWYWTDRLGWRYAQWLEYLSGPVTTWVAYLRGTPVGYAELEQHPAGDLEIASFGLLPPFIGRGIGGVLLTHAVTRAWQGGATRVWLHTCTLDGPTALANYQARGFRIYHQETAENELSDAPPGPWPSAR